jgi:hypothetical protein
LSLLSNEAPAPPPPSPQRSPSPSSRLTLSFLPPVTSLHLAARPHFFSRFRLLPSLALPLACPRSYAEGGMAMYARLMLGHLTHPSIAHALLLEHGCGE